VHRWRWRSRNVSNRRGGCVNSSSRTAGDSVLCQSLRREDTNGDDTENDDEEFVDDRAENYRSANHRAVNHYAVNQGCHILTRLAAARIAPTRYR
jgi:hypothetical protein